MSGLATADVLVAVGDAVAVSFGVAVGVGLADGAGVISVAVATAVAVAVGAAVEVAAGVTVDGPLPESSQPHPTITPPVRSVSTTVRTADVIRAATLVAYCNQLASVKLACDAWSLEDGAPSPPSKVTSTRSSTAALQDAAGGSVESRTAALQHLTGGIAGWRRRRSIARHDRFRDLWHIRKRRRTNGGIALRRGAGRVV
jgi:hypothetical protein